MRESIMFVGRVCSVVFVDVFLGFYFCIFGRAISLFFQRFVFVILSRVCCFLLYCIVAIAILVWLLVL